MSQKNSLIALSLFSGLYNEEKDIYSVLAEFILITLKSNKLLSQITPESIAIEIHKQFAFHIPVSVIKTACKRISQGDEYLHPIDGQKDTYQVDIRIWGDDTLEKIDIISANYNKLFDKLKKFIEQHRQENFQETEEPVLLTELYKYLVDNTTSGKYITLIEAFIISYSESSESAQIDELARGAVLYNCLQYTSGNEDFSDSWGSIFKIFLSTEIIFDMLNLNGELYERYALDLLDQVREVNKKKKYISLVYSEITMEEFKRFFSAAEEVVKHNLPIEYDKTAMRAIKDQCADAASVVNLYAELKVKLSKLGILLHDSTCSFNDPNFIKYNLDSNALRIELNDIGCNETKVNGIIADFTEINCLRKNQSFKRLEKSVSVLLTRDSWAIRINKLIASSNDDYIVPFCTSYDVLINRIWFKTSAFQYSKKLPITFDILARSQMGLTKVLDQGISRVITDVNKIIKSPNVSNEEVEAAGVKLAEIKDRIEIRDKRINNSSIPYVLKTLALTENKTEEVIRRVRLKDSKTMETMKEKDNEIDRLKSEVKQAKVDKNKNIQDQILEISLKNKTLDLHDRIAKYSIWGGCVLIGLLIFGLHSYITELIIPNIIHANSQNVFDAFYYVFLVFVCHFLRKKLWNMYTKFQKNKKDNIQQIILSLESQLISLDD